MYLVALLDWYSRYVLSWEVDMTLEMPFVLSTVTRALAQAVPVICNSDQGSHFTSPQYITLLRAANVQISMDGKGRALDNIFTERLWSVNSGKNLPKSAEIKMDRMRGIVFRQCRESSLCRHKIPQNKRVSPSFRNAYSLSVAVVSRSGV